MAAAKQHTKKGRKTNRRSSFLRSFGACFGISNKVSADHGDRKSLSGRHPRAALPVNDQYIPAPSTEEIVNSSKEIRVVEDDDDKEKLSPSADDLMSNKQTRERDITSEKSKNREESNSGPMIIKRAEKQNSSVNDTWTNQRKLSHSVSLPVPHQKREKPAATAGVEKKGNRGKEVAAVGGEFDSTVGAVMISVTLVVMIIWGKICAVVCTAAWFYFVPRFRAKMEESYANSMELRKNGESVDLDSWEYKKRVVLQGLLHRKNQNL